MPTAWKYLETSLAWLWVACLLASALDLAGVLQFASRPVASGVHWAVLGLAFAATAHWHWGRAWPWVPWVMLPGVALLWLVSPLLSVLGYFTQVPGKVAYALLFDGGDAALWRWETNYVYFRRGSQLLVQQGYPGLPDMGGSADQRTVRLVPVWPLWHLVRPSPAADSAALVAQGWVPISQPPAYFSFDPAEQARLTTEKARLDKEARREREAYEADPANQAMEEAVKRDAEQNRASE